MSTIYIPILIWILLTVIFSKSDDKPKEEDSDDDCNKRS